jgi:ketosteroid isomerase-like protein
MRYSVCLLAALLLSCREAPQGVAANSEVALRAANAAYDKALLDGDANALGRFYTDDFQIIDARAEVHGKADQIKFMTEQVDLLQAKTDDVRITMLSPDAALFTGRFIGRYRLDGKENDFTERYTSIWVRQGDQWRLKHEHSSMAPRS